MRHGVVAKHRVDRLRELGTARLVDAAGVVPDPLVSIGLRDLTASSDLLGYVVARVLALRFASLGDLPYILEGLLLWFRGLVPDVGQNGIPTVW